MTSLTLMVCPHDTVKGTEHWYRLVQYLSKGLDTEVHFELALDFADFHERMATADLIYANTTDSLKLIAQHGFTPVARPADRYDEAVIVANPDLNAPDFAAMQDQPIAVVPNAAPTLIGLTMLQQQGITPAAQVARDSWLSVISSVWRNEAPFGIVYKDTYDGLSEQSRAMVQLLTASAMQRAFHLFSIHPRAGAHQAALTSLLTAMESSPDGQAILAELRFPRWLAATPEDIAGLQQLMG